MEFKMSRLFVLLAGLAIAVSAWVAVPVQAQEPLFTLLVVKSGPGNGSVMSTPAGISCYPVCISASALFTANAVVTLHASPDAGSVFLGWNGTCADGGAGLESCTVVMDTDRTVEAIFVVPDQYELSISKSGSGTVTSAPAGIDCGPTCSYSFEPGTPITLTAVPAPGWSFRGFEATFPGGTAVCLGNDPCPFTINGPTSVVAYFEEVVLSPCEFVSLTPVWKSSTKTITWNVVNTIPASSVPIDQIYVFFDGGTIQAVSLEGQPLPLAINQSITYQIFGNGVTLGPGNHQIIFSFLKPKEVLGRHFNATMYFGPLNCNPVTTGDWIVR